MSTKEDKERRKALLAPYSLSEQAVSALSEYPFVDLLKKDRKAFLNDLKTFKNELVPSFLSEQEFKRLNSPVPAVPAMQKVEIQVIVDRDINIREIKKKIEKNERLRGTVEWYKTKLSEDTSGAGYEDKIGKIYDACEKSLLKRKEQLEAALKDPELHKFFALVAGFYNVGLPEGATCYLLASEPESESTGYTPPDRDAEIFVVPRFLGAGKAPGETVAYDLDIIAHEFVHIIERKWDTKQLIGKNLKKDEIGEIRHAIVYSMVPGATLKYCKRLLANDDTVFKVKTSATRNWQAKILAGKLAPKSIEYLDEGKKIDAEYIRIALEEFSKL
jgi:hypothetical protein